MGLFPAVFHLSTLVLTSVTFIESFNLNIEIHRFHGNFLSVDKLLHYSWFKTFKISPNLVKDLFI